jgi:hypothetical protein
VSFLLALVAATGGGGGSTDLVPLYYITGTIGALVGVWYGLAKWYSGAKTRWLEEGQSKRKQTEALDANTRAAKENSEALKALAAKLEHFESEVLHEQAAIRAELNGQGQRLTTLERRRQPRTPAT